MNAAALSHGRAGVTVAGPVTACRGCRPPLRRTVLTGNGGPPRYPRAAPARESGLLRLPRALPRKGPPRWLRRACLARTGLARILRAGTMLTRHLTCPHGTAQPARNGGIAGQDMGTAELVELQQVLRAAQEPVGGGQVLGVGAAHVAARGERGERGKRGRAAQ